MPVEPAETPKRPENGAKSAHMPVIPLRFSPGQFEPFANPFNVAPEFAEPVIRLNLNLRKLQHG